MTLLVVTIIVMQWLALAWLLLDARRERERQAHVLATFTRDTFERERELLNRIKPETAQYALADAEPLPAARFDDDDDFFAATRGLTKEELAEAVDGSDG